MESATPLRRKALYKVLADMYNRLTQIYNERIDPQFHKSGSLLFEELESLFSRLFQLASLLWRLFSTVFLNPYVKVFIVMVQAQWLIILLLFLTYLPLSSMDQATDVFRVISAGDPLNWTICAHISVFVFALTVWFSCRMIFIRFDCEYMIHRIYGDRQRTVSEKSTLREFMRWIPPLLGLVPFILLIQGLSGHEGGGSQIALILVEIHLYFRILLMNNRFLKPDAIGTQTGNAEPEYDGVRETTDDLSLKDHPFAQLRVRYRLLIYLLCASCFALFVICARLPTNLLFSRSIGVVAGVFLAMSMWVFLAHALLLLDHRHKAPIAVLTLGIILFFWNTNNHQIRTLGDSYFEKEKLGDRTIAHHFVKWVAWRQNSIDAWQRDSTHTDRYPIYIIAAEGGGLRAGYWTAAVLGQLSKRIPHFYNRVYALSTVSGGSVGAAVYTKLYADSIQNAQTFGPTVDESTKAILHQDYMSPLTMAFLVPDMLQKLSPVGINAFDRAQYLEDALSKAYIEVVRTSLKKDETSYSLDEPFMSIWRGNQLYQVPSLFMNCTRVENGAKAVLSNLLIEGQSFNGANGKEVIDLQELIHRNVRISTAAFMSARFPIVTPPATVQHTDAQRSDRSNFVDGGYIDNSGLETALAVITSIRSANASDVLREVYGRDTETIAKVNEALKQVEVHLILIKNSEQNEDEPAPVRGLYELKAPLLAFVNSWDRHIGSKLNVARSYLRLAAKRDPDPTKTPIGVDSTLVLFDVDRKQELVPLGWYMSDKAQECMNRQADSLPKLKRYKQYIDFNLQHLK